MSDNKVYTGIVIWFQNQKGYGFISWSKDGIKQKDIFCHYSDIVSDSYKTLSKDNRVSFTIGVNHHGDPKATSVTVLK